MKEVPLNEAEWDGVGGLRALFMMVCRNRLDQVLVRNASADVISQLLRSGFAAAPDCNDPANWMLRPLLNASSLEPVQHPFFPTMTDVHSYGNESGDLNPVHFDHAFAQAMGLEGPIIHGMLFNAWVTRYLGMDWPGAGTLFKRSDTLYIAPVYPDRPYSIRTSVPIADIVRGHYRVVSQLLDEHGSHCTIAYSDVVHRNAPLHLPGTCGDATGI